MNNLLTKLTTSPRAGRYSPLFEIFNDFDNAFFAPENFSNDNIRFNETDKQLHVEIDLPGVKKEDLKVTYNEDTNLAYVKAKRNITTKTGTTGPTRMGATARRQLLGWWSPLCMLTHRTKQRGSHIITGAMAGSPGRDKPPARSHCRAHRRQRLAI